MKVNLIIIALSFFSFPFTSYAQEMVCETQAECIIGDAACEADVIEVVTLNFKKKGTILEMTTPEGDVIPLKRVSSSPTSQSYLFMNEYAAGYMTITNDGVMIFSAHRLFEDPVEPYTISAYGFCDAAPTS